MNPLDYVTCIWFGIVDFLDAHNGAISAVGTVVIAAFTIALAWSTKKLWREARLASRIAYKAARAAQKSANVSERAMLQVQRAFVSAEGLGATPIVLNGKVDGCVVQAGWINTGSTDAIHGKAGITHTVTDSMQVDTVQFAHNPIKQNDNMTIGARTSSITSNDLVRDKDVRLVWEGKARLFVLARIEYEDVFGEQHHTQVCAEITANRSPFTVPPLPETFMTGIWREHNSSR
jgi:hypothetical protein